MGLDLMLVKNHLVSLLLFFTKLELILQVYSMMLLKEHQRGQDAKVLHVNMDMEQVLDGILQLAGDLLIMEICSISSKTFLKNNYFFIFSFFNIFFSLSISL